MATPKSFKSLGIDELRRLAVEDFAVAIEPDDSKDAVLAALAEANIEWSDYVKQHPELAPTTPEVVVAPATVVEPLAVEPINVRVAEAPVAAANDRFLIKMTRENPLFEVRGYRFTQEHPYQLVTPADAQYLLSRETGFRQAFPDELSEFYG